MYKYRFTVFTPCFNSATTIHRVIESLNAQTFRDFEWILVDDCSTDDLESVIAPFKKSTRIPFQFIKIEENRGKPSAINLGVSRANGEFFLIIDADDAFTPDALETFNHVYDSLPESIKPEISSVTANCKDQNGKFIGTEYPSDENDVLVCDVFDMRYLYKVEGEKWGFTKTDVMKEFPFETKIDKFVTENTVWFAIADKYKSAFVNRTLRIYYRFESESSLSSIGQKKHPAGFVFYNRELINKYMKKMRLSPMNAIRIYKNYLKYVLLAKYRIIQSIGELHGFARKTIAFTCIPLAYLAVYLDKRKRMK